jgi:hypothetical protein
MGAAAISSGIARMTISLTVMVLEATGCDVPSFLFPSLYETLSSRSTLDKIPLCHYYINPLLNPHFLHSLFSLTVTLSLTQLFPSFLSSLSPSSNPSHSLFLLSFTISLPIFLSPILNSITSGIDVLVVSDMQYVLPLMLTVMAARFIGNIFIDGVYDIHIVTRRLNFLDEDEGYLSPSFSFFLLLLLVPHDW